MRKHLAAVRGSILAGAHLLFSHIIPQNFPRPQSHPMWQLAEQVGRLLKSLSHAQYREPDCLGSPGLRLVLDAIALHCPT